MNIPVHQNDLILAQETFEELRSGNNEAILGIYNKYQPLFIGYTRRRIQRYDSDRATLILDDFWVELLNARAICDFKGLSSLKTYLFKKVWITGKWPKKVSAVKTIPKRNLTKRPMPSKNNLPAIYRVPWQNLRPALNG
jgi:hypothetical protein